jgi:hypothetical protein
MGDLGHLMREQYSESLIVACSTNPLNRLSLKKFPFLVRKYSYIETYRHNMALMASRRNGVVEPRYRYFIYCTNYNYIPILVELFRIKELLTNPTLIISWATRHST